jgi:transcription-repair coupling factor (superfamily II helicase)
MRLLRDAYRDDDRVQECRQALLAGRDLVIGACHGGLIPTLIAAWWASSDRGRPRVVVAGDAPLVAEDLEELGVPVAWLPELDRFADEATDERGLDRAGHTRRMAALEAYAKGAVLIATPVAVEQPVPDLADVVGKSIVVKPGEEHDLHQLVDRLVAVGYQVKTTVEGRGELAVRGGLIDVFPWIGNDPYRLEFFGDNLESIRRFDAFTQESIAQATEAVLASAKGGLATRSLWQQLPAEPLIVLGDLPLRGRLKKDHGRAEIRFARQLEEGALDAGSTGVERLRGDLRRGLKELARILNEAPSAGENAARAVLFTRNDEAKRELEANCRDAKIRAEVRTGRISAGFRDLEAGLVVVHDFELAEREPTKRRANRVAGGSPLSSLNDLKRGDHVVHLRHGIGLFRGMATLEKRGFLEDFLLLEFAGETKLYVPVEAIDLVQKYVGASGRAPELSTIGGQAWAKKRAKAEKAIEDMSGELLAAQAARIAAGGIAFPADTPAVRRFAAVFPFEETEDQLAAVREITADMERPVAMDRLLCGDVGFGKTEVAMRAAFKAAESGRQVAVLAPTTLLAEQHLESFTERFAGTGIVLAGLNRFRSPKERREVLAKLAAGEIQVLIGTHAILTEELKFTDLGLLIVDEEHRFGVKQKEKLRALRAASSVESGNSQLATRNSQLASGAKPPDVLTLSATPIPRTLHFSMLGLRDISVLAEAPAARMAVETRVAPWDDALVEHACRRELDRQGQLFVVHHQVKDLDQLAYRFSKLVPGMRLDTIHGQMDEDRIHRVMEAFRHRELDCLVATSIIESGIDIPNANTLFVSNAHHFGLAELHQIRGRVGRFTRQAYAYFLTPAHRELGEDAVLRLNALQEYAELGAGFKLAMRDLELRGAGNLLGGEQSGQIDAIGYELYAKMLNDAVERAKATAGSGERVRAESPKPRNPESPFTDPAAGLLSLQVDAYIPDTYLEMPQLKFELHKNLDGCRTLAALASLAKTARDRFGAFPDQVVRLFQVKALKLRAKQLGLERVEVADRQIRLRLAGAMPKELMQASVPEVVHIQPDGPMLVLFVRIPLDQDKVLNLLCRILSLDLGFLGRGF